MMNEGNDKKKKEESKYVEWGTRDPKLGEYFQKEDNSEKLDRIEKKIEKLEKLVKK
jgi:hypothetical protein